MEYVRGCWRAESWDSPAGCESTATGVDGPVVPSAFTVAVDASLRRGCAAAGGVDDGVGAATDAGGAADGTAPCCDLTPKSSAIASTAVTAAPAANALARARIHLIAA